jgi:hypothetical protein
MEQSPTTLYPSKSPYDTTHVCERSNIRSQLQLSLVSSILCTDLSYDACIWFSHISNQKKKVVVWNGVHSASWVQLKSYLIEK